MNKTKISPPDFIQLLRRIWMNSKNITYIFRRARIDVFCDIFFYEKRQSQAYIHHRRHHHKIKFYQIISSHSYSMRNLNTNKDFLWIERIIAWLINFLLPLTFTSACAHIQNNSRRLHAPNIYFVNDIDKTAFNAANEHLNPVKVYNFVCNKSHTHWENLLWMST